MRKANQSLSGDAPKFRLKVSEPLKLSTISSSLEDLSAETVRSVLERTLHEHYLHFRTTPYQLIFDRRTREYAIVASAEIGQLDCGFFVLEIEPKFSQLEIGKCLQLAHYCQFSDILHHTNRVLESEVSESLLLEGIDYFGEAFLSSIIDVINSGLLTRQGTREGPDPLLRGTLVMDRQIATGGNLASPYMRRAIMNADVPANRTLKAALQLCKEKSSFDNIKGLSLHCLEYFGEVQATIAEYDFSFQSSLRRKDYERSLALAKIILEGYNPYSGGTASFQPSFTINLDKLFEAFISFEIRNRLPTERFQVATQASFDHPYQPVVSGTKVIPDLVVTLIGNGKSIVVDCKNKYSTLEDESKHSLNNQDLFQITYYALATGSAKVALLYPGNARTATAFPLPGSEGKNAYEKKVEKAFKKIRADNSFRMSTEGVEIELFVLRVNLAGSLKDSLRSVTEVAMFISRILDES